MTVRSSNLEKFLEHTHEESDLGDVLYVFPKYYSHREFLTESL